MTMYRVTRYVPKQIRDKTNLPHVEIQEYGREQVCKQGFLASMVDSDHRIKVALIPENEEKSY